MSEASWPPERLFLQCGNPGETPGSVDASDVTWAGSRVFPGDVEYVRADLAAGGCARDQRTTQYCAEAVAATARAEKAERALRLEQGRPAEGDLPPGWTQNTRRRDGRWYLLDYHADVWEQNEGWHWAIHGDGTPHHAASAAEAIDAAQAALEGGDDE